MHFGISDHKENSCNPAQATDYILRNLGLKLCVLPLTSVKTSLYTMKNVGGAYITTSDGY